MSYLLSIIVPTKERYQYLKPLISLIKNFNVDEIELVIQDNSFDNTEILKFIKDISFKHLKYFHYREKLTSVQNFDKAVFNSTGEYVCFIGDDDGVTRNISNCVIWMKKNSVEALRQRKSTSYLWPDAVINSGNKHASVLSYVEHNEAYEFMNPLVELNKTGKIGMQNIGLMPKLYHGIVRRDILEKIFNIGGTYFPGAAGDMANAVALCFVVHKFVVVDFPITIHGSSQMLGGGIVKKKNEMAKLSEVDFISQEVRDNWEKRIPPIWHTCFVWPESATKALMYMSKDEFIDNIDYDYMLAHFLSRLNFSYLETCVSFSKSKIRLFLYYLKFKYIGILVRMKALMSILFIWDNRYLYSVKLVRNVDNIIDAEEILFIKTGKINFDRLHHLK
jgi:glycosyltransferase involved in cell wall biosynthesis